MKYFLYYCSTISDHKYSDKRGGLLELNPMAKCTVHTRHTIIVTSCPTSFAAHIGEFNFSNKAVITATLYYQYISQTNDT